VQDGSESAGGDLFEISEIAYVDLYSAYVKKPNALMRSLVIWDHTVLPTTRQR